MSCLGVTVTFRGRASTQRAEIFAKCEEHFPVNDDDIVLVATSMTRFGHHERSSVKQLSREAVGAVLGTAGLEPDQIGMSTFRLLP